MHRKIQWLGVTNRVNGDGVWATGARRAKIRRKGLAPVPYAL